MDPFYRDAALTVWQGDCRTVLATLPAESVHAVVTSPPYWGLRDYGVAGQIGLEPSIDAYVDEMVAVFREVRRVLRADGTVWLNLGDSYASSSGRGRGQGGQDGGRITSRIREAAPGLKEKDLVGIPWRVAFALQADGWYLRRDVVWSKPNPMPESVTDRPTSAHEYVFLLTKSARYFYDADAVLEPIVSTHGSGNGYGRPEALSRGGPGQDAPWKPDGRGRNLRSVWTIPTQPYPGAHFATFPRKLVEPCILAGTSERGVCPTCGAPWLRVIERPDIGPRVDYEGKHADRPENDRGRRMLQAVRAGRLAGGDHDNPTPSRVTTGWRPGCRHGGEPDDYEVIRSPLGEGEGGDYHKARLTRGRGGPVRRGLSRDRQADEGTRPMYRWQQRDLARQMRALLDDDVVRSAMFRDATEAGYTKDAWDHWLRTDRSGARAIPAALLDDWVARGWLTWPVETATAEEPVPATVLDPFAGSGTTGLVAQALGRRAVLIDLNGDYLVQALERNRQTSLLLSAAHDGRANGRSADLHSAPIPLFGTEEGEDAATV